MAFIENTGLERLWGHIVHSLSLKADKEDLKILSKTVDEIPQADWNQNDETAKDYIKNRPFYTGDPVETVIVEETNITLEEGGDNTGLITASQPLEVGQEYTITIDGTQYNSVCNSVNVDGVGNIPYIGNLVLIGRSEDTSEPFFIAPMNSETELGIINDTGALEYTVSVVKIVTEIHHIDPKYIKDMYGEKIEILSRIYGDIDNGFRMSEMTWEDKEYIVLFDGVEHTTSWNYSRMGSRDECYYLGDNPLNNTEDFPFSLSVYSSRGSLKLPFTGSLSIITYDNEFHDIKVIEKRIHHIDPKYIKDMYYTSDPVETMLVDNLTSEDYDNGKFPACNFIEGNTYKVIWNGEVYDNLICEFNGELDIIASEDNGCPFYIDDDGGDGLYIENHTEEETYTVSIIEYKQDIHQLDPKYIPDSVKTHDWNTLENRPFYEIPEVWNKAELIDDTWNTRATCKLASTPIEWAKDNQYRIRVDGIEYNFDGMKKFAGTAATGAVNVYYIGATYIPFNSNMDFSEYPFCLLTTDFENIYAVFEDTTLNHTVEFFESEGIIQQIDPKYIKDMYYDETTEEHISLDIEGVVDGEGIIHYNWNKDIPYTLRMDGEIYYFDSMKNAGYNSAVGQNIYYLGASIKPGGSVIEWDYPFTISIPEFRMSDSSNDTVIKFEDGTSNHTIDIVRKVKKIQQIDPKYIPDSVKAQSDWSQSDSTASDYIKNRTHWEEENVVNIENLRFDNLTKDSSGATVKHGHDIPLALGQVWNVTFVNGGGNVNTDYSHLEVKESEDGTLYLGDNNVIDGVDIPFCITSTDFSCDSGWVRMLQPTDICVIGVSGTYSTGTTVHQLDEKYIPDTIARIEDIDFDEIEILTETGVVDPVTNENGQVLTDENNTIYIF